ncbi:MAG TPA: RsmB/NOP family class I SAM-dependent RNA methyltransferase [bacterium]|nr:RsmB/NOP family class I SAM-dependent RNA methyltransferase [bacterium]HPN36141.1 RsmB/NOP family class I SAM-dependent RNA methyltransferase [bacterium]
MELIAYLKTLFGDELPAFLAAAPEPPTVAVNVFKCDRRRFVHKLDQWGMSYSPHPVEPASYILESDPLPLSHTLSFFIGDFRYQGVSSQLPALALDPQPGETVLDLAAAPGGKSIQIAALMNNQGRLLLNDSSLKRMEPLMANLSRAAVVNDVLLNLPGQKIGRLLPEFFDRVLVDAPCSGLNFYSDRLQRQQWNAHYLQTIVNIQEQLLISAVKAAKVNGVIVYSTCSMTPEENEMVLQRILQRYPVRVETAPKWTLRSARPGWRYYQERAFPSDLQKTLRIYPFPDPMEGFFLARLRKTAGLPIRPVNQPVRWLPTQRFDDPRILPILTNLHQLWGIEPSFFAPYRFRVNTHKLWLTTDAWPEIPDTGLVKTGLPLAVKKSHFWKLTSSAAQWLSGRITASLMELSSNQLHQLLSKGETPHPGEALRYYAATRHGKPIGVVSQSHGVLKLKIPHSFKLVQDADV